MNTPNVSTIRKALAAAAGSAVTALVIGLGAALSDGALTGAEVGVSIGGALLAAGAVGRTVWAVPNELTAGQAALRKALETPAGRRLHSDRRQRFRK